MSSALREFLVDLLNVLVDPVRPMCRQVPGVSGKAQGAKVGRLHPPREGRHAGVHAGPRGRGAVPGPRHQPRQEPPPAHLAPQRRPAVQRALQGGGESEAGEGGAEA